MARKFLGSSAAHGNSAPTSEWRPFTRKISVLLLVVLCTATATASEALPEHTLKLPLHRIVNQTSYGVEMEIGTPPQRMSVLVDTGSSQIGLQGTNSNWCKLPYKPCALYGSYNNKTSTTAKYLNGSFYNTLINHGFGSYINDVVRVGGKAFPKVDFGMITDYEASYPAPNPNSGLMGLVPTCNDNPKCNKPYKTTLQQQLLYRGYLKKNVLSVYLGPEEESAVGHLLYGAIDRAKQKGKPVTMPVIDVSSEIANLSPNYVNLSSMSLELSKSRGSSTSKLENGAAAATSVQKFKVVEGAYVLFDTGYPNFDLPKEAWFALKKYFSLKGDSDETGAYNVDCKFRKQQSDDATLLVGFKDDALQIRIPVSRFVTRRAAGHCVTSIGNCGTNGKGCPFGDAFIRSVYLIFDFENLTITLSNVKYTNETDIVPA